MQNYGKVTYANLSPITNTGTEANVTVNLPTSATNNITLADDGASNTLSRLSGNSIEQTDFSNPTGTLTISRGTGSDTLLVSNLPDFTGGLTIGSSISPFSAVTFSGVVSLGSGKSLSADATGAILLNGSANLGVSASGGVTLTTTAEYFAGCGNDDFHGRRRHLAHREFRRDNRRQLRGHRYQWRHGEGDGHRQRHALRHGRQRQRWLAIWRVCS